MKLRATLLCCLLCVLLFEPVPPAIRISPVRLSDPSENVRYPKRTRAHEAARQEYLRTLDPALGDVPRERLMRAYQVAQRRAADPQRAAIPGITWDHRGPANVGGRTRALLVDANDGTGNTLWAAGVAGGLWKTTDITATRPLWQAVDDFFANLAITALVQDPVNPQVMYFGTGEGFFNSDAVRGDGIWKTTDGGATWAQLASTDGQNDFQYVNRLAIHPGTGAILAACRSIYINRGGIMRSTDGGTTWTRTLAGSTGLYWAADVQVAANGDIYASIGINFTDGVYKSTDGGVTWTQVLVAAANEQRIEIALAPSDANYVYLLIEGASNAISRVLRSTNAGGAWTTITPGAVWSDQCTAPVADFTRGQAFYDLCAAVDPNDETRLYIGGIDILLSEDAGATWSQVTQWADCNGTEDVHADQHILRFAPGSSSVLYAGNDGGVYRSGDAGTANLTFQAKEHGYSTAQFYSCAMHPDAGSGHFLAGAQDNGSHRFDALGGAAYTVEVTGGDGAFCHIDQNQSQYQWTSYVYQNFRRSTDGGQTFSNVNVGSNGQFINPSDYDDTGNYFFAGSSAGQYLLWSDPQTGATFSNVAVADFGGGSITAVSASPNTSERVWFGLNNGRVVRVDQAATAPASTNLTGGSFPAGSVSCIAVEPGDDTHLLVTYSNYGVTSVWETTDGGGTWTAVEGNLPDMPVRWALFNPLDATQALLATELGVWSTTLLSGGATDWQPSNTGLAHVRVDMLQYRSSDHLILAATHGRGLYSSPVFTSERADFEAARTRWFAQRSLAFYDRSYQATSWSWDFGDGSAGSTAPNPTHTYASPGTYTVTLTLNGGTATETKVNYLTILDEPTLPYYADFNTHDNGFYPYRLTDGDRSWEWGQSSSGYFNSGIYVTVEGAASWITDLDNHHGFAQRYALESPPFDLTGGSGNYMLEFTYRMAADFGSGMNMEYSTDGGQIWTVLGTVGDPLASNWYTDQSLDGLDNQPGWRKATYNTFNPSYDIAFLQGNSDVRFRFVFGASYSVMDGAQVDEFTVYDDFVVLEPVVELPAPSPEAQPLVRTYPNPLGDQLSLETGGLAPETQARLRFYDPQGRLVRTHAFTVPASGRLTIPTHDLPRGLYLLEVSSPGQRVVQRVWRE